MAINVPAVIAPVEILIAPKPNIMAIVSSIITPDIGWMMAVILACFNPKSIFLLNFYVHYPILNLQYEKPLLNAFLLKHVLTNH